MSKYE